MSSITTLYVLPFNTLVSLQDDPDAVDETFFSEPPHYPELLSWTNAFEDMLYLLAQCGHKSLADEIEMKGLELPHDQAYVRYFSKESLLKISDLASGVDEASLISEAQKNNTYKNYNGEIISLKEFEHYISNWDEFKQHLKMTCATGTETCCLVTL